MDDRCVMVSLSPSEAESVRVRILRDKTSRFEPLNRQRRVRTPSPTFRFMVRDQRGYADWPHFPPHPDSLRFRRGERNHRVHLSSIPRSLL